MSIAGDANPYTAASVQLRHNQKATRLVVKPKCFNILVDSTGWVLSDDKRLWRPMLFIDHGWRAAKDGFLQNRRYETRASAYVLSSVELEYPKSYEWFW